MEWQASIGSETNVLESTGNTCEEPTPLSQPSIQTVLHYDYTKNIGMSPARRERKFKYSALGRQLLYHQKPTPLGLSFHDTPESGPSEQSDTSVHSTPSDPLFNKREITTIPEENVCKVLPIFELMKSQTRHKSVIYRMNERKTRCRLVKPRPLQFNDRTFSEKVASLKLLTSRLRMICMTRQNALDSNDRAKIPQDCIDMFEKFKI